MQFARKTLILICIALLTSTSFLAQVSEVFEGIDFYQSPKSVRAVMNPVSERMETVVSEAPNFPLATQIETHIIYHNVQIGDDIVERVVFTFGDDKLQYIEAYGNAFTTVFNKIPEEPKKYIDYSVFFSKGILGNAKKDIVWILSKESLHLNLFAWENPYLKDGARGYSNYDESVVIPNFLKMGGSYESLKPMIFEASKFANEMELSGSDPNAQLQIDGFGIEYAGFPRKVEARFGDGKLNVVWILTGKEEEDRIRKALTNEFGPATAINDKWEQFNEGRVWLRKDKPEILLLNDTLIEEFKKHYYNK